MYLPNDAVGLAGFTLAHAAWSVSDLPDGELLIPLAITAADGRLATQRFEDGAQAEAIARGRAAIEACRDDVDAWAFAREGVIREGANAVDVLTVSSGARGMSTTFDIVQRFRPFASGAFAVLGEVDVIVDRVKLVDGRADEIRRMVRAGVESHGKVAELWDGWVEQGRGSA